MFRFDVGSKTVEKSSRSVQYAVASIMKHCIMLIVLLSFFRTQVNAVKKLKNLN